MALYVFSAWILALLFTLVIGSWHDATFATVPLAAVGIAGLLLLVMMHRAPWIARRPRPEAPDEQQMRWAGQLCDSISAPSIALQGPVVSFANQALLALLNYRGRGDEVIGLPFTNLLHPKDHAAFASLLAIANGSSPSEAQASLRLLRADGNLAKAQVSVSPLSVVPGSVLIQFGSGDDAAAPRTAAEDSLALMLDQLDLALFKTDIEGRLVYVNRAWERLSGHGAIDSKGRLLSASIHPGDRDDAAAALLAIGQGQSNAFDREVRMVSASGNVFWVQLRAQAFTQLDGDLIGITGTMQEIAPRKRHDESLGSTRRYLNTLLANVPGMVYRGRNDLDWTMEFVSDGCFELTGFEPYELVESQRVSFGKLIHPEDRQFVWEHVQSHLAQHKSYQLSYRIVDAEGALRWVWEQGRGVFSSHGEFLALEGFITDISEQRGAAETARRKLWFESRTGMTSRPIFDTLLAYMLQHALATGTPCAVLWVDVYGMAERIERVDREGSEQVLSTLARRFQPTGHPGATTSYVGNYQFAVLLTDFRPGGASRAAPERGEVIAAAAQMADRLVKGLMQPLAIKGESLPVEVAVGIAISDARYIGGEAMLDAARNASRQAMELGAGHCEFADE